MGGLAFRAAKASLCALLVAGSLAACTGPTGYTKAGSWSSNYGYKEKRVDADEFSISVTGNSRTAAERAVQIAVLRAARLTREQGGTHFVIVHEKAGNMETAKMVSLSVFSGGAAVFLPVHEYASSEPTAILLIRIVRGGAPPADAIEAELVIERLGKQFE